MKKRRKSFFVSAEDDTGDYEVYDPDMHEDSYDDYDNDLGMDEQDYDDLDDDHFYDDGFDDESDYDEDSETGEARRDMWSNLDWDKD